MSAADATATDFPVMGAHPRPDGRTTFRVWAPAAEVVAVHTRGATHELQRSDDGVFAGDAPAAPGDDYEFVLDGEARLPDPCSRFQPEGLRGPSRVVDLSAGATAANPGLTLENLVLYELHVGTFSDEGTFDGVIERLGDLRELGITAIAVMPIATFAGNHGWGYDGVYTYAPHPAYGGPDGFRRLVEAAHQ